ncbi:MAG: hypothetical protein K9K63_00785 [Desulfotignum sp.]|nr:hypothetical protein [Desulfotignum sp.]MCF8089530.1 hypothetical protein [Desulfotignum sp.]MCF8135828.1 hypothetical protein [Desulfotignum sp.]
MEETISIDWLSVGMLLATIVLAFLTGAYVFLTKRLVKSQVDPYIAVFVHHDNTRPTIIQLIIRNIGAAVAKNIKFTINGSLPARAFGLEEKTSKEANKMVDGPLISGIPALIPGEDRRIDWGQYGGLMKSIGDKEIIIKAIYETDDSRKITTDSVVEVKSFLNTNASKYDPYEGIVKELEKISHQLNNIGSKESVLTLKVDNK